MRAIRVHYEDGDTIETNINTHYLGHVFNLGDGAGGDRMVRAVRVEFLDTKESTISGGPHTEGIQRSEVEFDGLIGIGDQIQSIETNWQGRVTGFQKLDGDDCTYLVCHHVSGGEIELDDKRWFDPRDVRLLRKAGK